MHSAILQLVFTAIARKWLGRKQRTSKKAKKIQPTRTKRVENDVEQLPFVCIVFKLLTRINFFLHLMP